MLSQINRLKEKVQDLAENMGVGPAEVGILQQEVWVFWSLHRVFQTPAFGGPDFVVLAVESPPPPPSFPPPPLPAEEYYPRT